MSQRSGGGGSEGPDEESLHMRLKVINEIIATERDFVRDLQTISEHIMKPLEDKNNPYSKLFSASERSTLFSNIAMIEVMCSDLLKLFEQVASEADRPADAALGKAYISKKIALTASFSAYCANQSKMLSLFESMKKKAAFTGYLQHLRDMPQLRGLGLLDWLIKPVQRVTKYPLLLRELEKFTPPNHSDYENTVLASRAVQELVDQVNIAAKTTESIQSMTRISEEVSDIPDSLKLTKTPGRFFVTEGRFIKVSHGKHQERHFFMFSDLIMYAKLNLTGKKYTFKGFLILTKSNYEDLPDGNEFGNNAIRITRLDSKKTYIIYCKESTQKHFWISNINDLKGQAARGVQVSLPTIGVVTIVHDSNGSTDAEKSIEEFSKAANSAISDSQKSSNSLVMIGVEERIAGWTNDDPNRYLLHEGPLKCKVLGKDCDYCFLFNDAWMATKTKLFKTAQSSKKGVDFKVMIPISLITHFLPKENNSIDIGYRDEDGKTSFFIAEAEDNAKREEFIAQFPFDKMASSHNQTEPSSGRESAPFSSPASMIPTRISRQMTMSAVPRDGGPPIPAIPARSNTLSSSSPILVSKPSTMSLNQSGNKSPAPPIPATHTRPSDELSSSAPIANAPPKFGDLRTVSSHLGRSSPELPQVSNFAANRKTSPRPTTPNSLQPKQSVYSLSGGPPKANSILVGSPPVPSTIASPPKSNLHSTPAPSTPKQINFGGPAKTPTSTAPKVSPGPPKAPGSSPASLVSGNKGPGPAMPKVTPQHNPAGFAKATAPVQTPKFQSPPPTSTPKQSIPQNAAANGPQGPKVPAAGLKKSPIVQRPRAGSKDDTFVPSSTSTSAYQSSGAPSLRASSSVYVSTSGPPPMPKVAPVAKTGVSPKVPASGPKSSAPVGSGTFKKPFTVRQ